MSATRLQHVSLGLDPASCQVFVFHFYSYIKVPMLFFLQSKSNCLWSNF